MHSSEFHLLINRCSTARMSIQTQGMASFPLVVLPMLSVKEGRLVIRRWVKCGPRLYKIRIFRDAVSSTRRHEQATTPQHGTRRVVVDSTPPADKRLNAVRYFASQHLCSLVISEHGRHESREILVASLGT